MSKRPAIDLMALTSDQATPMPEAVQRSAPPAPPPQAAVVPMAKPAAQPAPVRAGKGAPAPEHVPTANLESLAFKVSPAFRKRFRSRAAEADLKLNELLFAAFDAWEVQQGYKKA